MKGVFVQKKFTSFSRQGLLVNAQSKSPCATRCHKSESSALSCRMRDNAALDAQGFDLAKERGLKVTPAAPEHTKNEVLAYSAKGTAQVLDVGLRSVRRAIARGEIRTVRFGRRVLIPRSEIDRFLRGDKK